MKWLRGFSELAMRELSSGKDLHLTATPVNDEDAHRRDFGAPDGF
jgi:hypothetical protein